MNCEWVKALSLPTATRLVELERVRPEGSVSNTECETASMQRTHVAYIYLARRVAAAYGVLYLTFNGPRLHTSQAKRDEALLKI